MSTDGRRPPSVGITLDNLRSSGARYTHREISPASQTTFGDGKYGFDHEDNLSFKSGMPLKNNKGALLVPKKVSKCVGKGKSILVDSLEKFPLKSKPVNEVPSKSISKIVANEHSEDNLLVRWSESLKE
ncbi:hypothetical protein MA16_Dca026101 [Dendrobium catenatum]|uniref:Uncharacterized protein n=1 Tax=Dendrobium catenatum TaxID=906689 RepID=A0A2I0WXS6_9ASPA|nr:hypothetical protein MA16_Dca026101 [Dendrobium catenatum]